MSIFVCPRCSKYIDLDFDSEEVYSDGENDDICMDCHDKRVQKEYAYWKPLYDAEVRAGLYDPKLGRYRTT